MKKLLALIVLTTFFGTLAFAQGSGLTMQKMTAAGEHYKKGDSYFQNHNYKKAAKEYATSFNLLGNNGKAAYNAACAFSLLKETDSALHYLDQALKSGYLDFAQSTYLDNLHGNGQYNILVARASIIKQSIKDQQIKPVIILPPNYNPQKQYPLLVGFHSFNSSPQEFGAHWKGLASQYDCILMLCRGTEPLGVGKFAWNKSQDEYERIMDEIDMTKLKYPIRKNDVIFIGYAEGADIAYALGAVYSSKAKGVIPIDGTFPKNYNMEIIKNKNLRVYSIVGKQDNKEMVSENIALKQRFTTDGIPFKLTLLDLDHQFPPHEDSLLSQALKWVLTN